MSVVLDILRTYRAPRETVGRRIGTEVREDRALAVLMAACVLIFVGQWPRIAREAHLDPSVGFDARFAGALFAWLLMAPLIFYVLALIVHGALRLAGRPASGFAVRMGLFWGLLAASPLFLLTGLTAGFVGAGPALKVISGLALGVLVVFWIAGIQLAAGQASKTGN